MLIPLLLVFAPAIQVVNADHGFEHDTCFNASIEVCKTVTAKAKTETVFLARCIVTLADGNEIAGYKVNNTCLDWQTKYGGMTYAQYQDDAMTDFNNRQNEARENVCEMFAPDKSLSDQLDELEEKLDELRNDDE